MQFFLKRISKNSVEKENQTFSSSFLQTLTPPYLPQKKIKNLILKEHFHLSERDLQTANQHHKRKSDFFSASYSGDWLLLGISKEKIGLDLEVINIRGESLLKKYGRELKPFFGKANWDNFYLLWTGKEAILKASDTTHLDKAENIQITQVKKEEKSIAGLPFSWKLTYIFEQKYWTVRSHLSGEIAYSICLKNK